MARLIIISLGIASMLGATSSAFAQAATSPADGTAQSITTEPEIVLSLVDADEKLFAWRSIRVEYSLVNGSLPFGIGVRSLTLSVPPALAVRPIGRTTRPDGSVELIATAMDLRTPGARRDFPPIEFQGTSLIDLKARILPVLTYRPRKEVFVATLNYEGLGDRKLGTKTTKLVVQVAAHPLGMYAGAVLGSFLAALFVVLFQRGRETAGAAESPAPTNAQNARNLFRRFIRGAIATGIAILLFQTTSDITLPINITVHDFYGGVILGLFGDKVGDEIFKRIFG